MIAPPPDHGLMCTSWGGIDAMLAWLGPDVALEPDPTVIAEPSPPT